MDYKYIEQLLERYWDGQTSLKEEAILRMFFAQEDVPVHLQCYKTLFEELGQQAEICLDDEFDKRLCALVEQQHPTVKVRRITFTQRLAPLYKAAAVVAITLTLGNAAQTSFKTEEDYNYSSYQDSYNDPEAAYIQVSEALKLVSERLNDANDSDTLGVTATPADK